MSGDALLPWGDLRDVRWTYCGRFFRRGDEGSDMKETLVVRLILGAVLGLALGVVVGGYMGMPWWYVFPIALVGGIAIGMA